MRAMIFILLTTIFWGIAAIFDKLALGRGAPFAGLLVRQLTVAVMIFLLAMGTGRLNGVFAMEGRSVLFFWLSGLCGGVLGLWTYYHALRIAGASLVVPITATYPLITVLLSWLILQESFTVSRIVGTVLIVVGVWLVK
jgi:bacterial/archaeal transporter family protein